MVRNKSIALLILFLGTTLLSFGNSTDKPQINDQKPLSVLLNIQSRVDSIVGYCFSVKDEKELNTILKDLKEEYQKHPVDINLYWQGYVQYYTSILQDFTDRSSEGKKTLKDGIETLEKTNKKNSETYALLGMMRSFSIRYNKFSAIFISKEAQKCASKAIQLDPKNPRGYYVKGSHEYYTPKNMRNNSKAIDNLKKTIQYSHTALSNPFMPSWGEKEAYELLIRLYKETKEEEKAKEYYKEAKNRFPNNYRFNDFDSI